MNIKSLSFLSGLLLSTNLICSENTLKEKIVDDYRLKNTLYNKIDNENGFSDFIFPKFTSLKEALDFSNVFIQSEKDFWKGEQERLCEDFPRFEIRKQLIDDAVLKPNKEDIESAMLICCKKKNSRNKTDDINIILSGMMDLINVSKKNKMIQNKESLSEKNDLSSLSKEDPDYDKIMRIAGSNAKLRFKMSLSEKAQKKDSILDSELDGIYSSYEDAITFLTDLNNVLMSQNNQSYESLLKALEKFNDEKANYYKDMYNLICHSVVKEIDESIKNQNHYEVSDSKYMKMFYSKFIKNILNNIQSVSLSEISATPKKKKFNKNKKKKIKNQPKNVIQKVDNIDLLEEKKVIEEVSQSFVPKDENTNVEQKDIRKEENKIEVDIFEKIEETTNIKKNISLEEYDLKPWDKYPSKNKDSKINTPKKEDSNQEKKEKEEIKLDESQMETLLAFFGKGEKYSQSKVAIDDFIQLLKPFEGTFYRTGKNIHYMAKNPKTKRWVSTAMHPLHKNEPEFLPRNTKFYWDRAKGLLIDLDLPELYLESN